MAEVLVVGGGPSGLTAALLAARSGASVALVEATARLGGMAASITVAGQRVDLGSHRLHPSAPPRVRALLDELLGDDLQLRQRNGRLRIDDRWARFPLDPVDLLRSLPPTLALRIGGELLGGAVLPSGDGGAAAGRDSYADVVRARLGRTVLEHFHGPYAQALWGVDPTLLDGDLARRRIALKGLGDVLGRLRRTRREGGGTFLYPRLGYGQVVDRLAAEVVDAGVALRRATQVTTLTPRGDDGDGVAATLLDAAGRTTRLDPRLVLWTAPPGPLAAALGHAPVPLEHRALAVVHLVVDADRWLPFDAHYVPTPDVPFVRLSEPKNYRDGPDPGGVTVLCAELPCSVGDGTWTAADAALAAAVMDGIGRLGLPVPAVVGHHVTRLPRVYPLLRRGQAATLRDEVDRLHEVPGVALLGRQGLGVADNLHHVLDMGIAVADRIGPGATFDRHGWRQDLDRFAGHVVED